MLIIISRYGKRAEISKQGWVAGGTRRQREGLMKRRLKGRMAGASFVGMSAH